MSTKTKTAKTDAERQAERRARLAAIKITRLELYVPEHMHERVKTYVRRISAMQVAAINNAKRKARAK